MEKLTQIKFKDFKDDRGSLTAIELKDYITWEPKRIYYLTDVTKPRGGHAVRGEKKIYVCQKGSIKARLHDGQKWNEFSLKENDGILMNGMCFRDFYEFSSDAVLLAISSVNYDAKDYIYDLEEFIKEVNS